MIGQNAITARANVVASLLTDADSAVAADAAFALGMLRDTSATALLANALARSPTVADAAAWSLGEFGGAGRPALERVLTSGQPRAALAAVLQASAKLRPVPAALITAYLKDSDIDVRRSAAYAVTRSRVPASARALIAVANESSRHDSTDHRLADVWSYVARGLGQPVTGDSLGDAAQDVLVRLTSHPHSARSDQRLAVPGDLWPKHTAVLSVASARSRRQRPHCPRSIAGRCIGSLSGGLDHGLAGGYRFDLPPRDSLRGAPGRRAPSSTRHRECCRVDAAWRLALPRRGRTGSRCRLHCRRRRDRGAVAPRSRSARARCCLGRSSRLDGFGRLVRQAIRAIRVGCRADRLRSVRSCVGPGRNARSSTRRGRLPRPPCLAARGA